MIQWKTWLLISVATQAVENGKGVWLRNLVKCLDDFEWQNIRVDTMGTLSGAEIEKILRNATWRKVKALLSKMTSKPNLYMVQQMDEFEEMSLNQKTAWPCIDSSL